MSKSVIEEIIAQLESKLSELKTEVSLTQRNSVAANSFSLVYPPKQEQPKQEFVDLGSRMPKDEMDTNKSSIDVQPEPFAEGIPDEPEHHNEIHDDIDVLHHDDSSIDDNNNSPVKPKLNLKDISVFVTGDRGWYEYESLRDRLDKTHKKFNIVKLNHAGNLGVETFASRWARHNAVLAWCNQAKWDVMSTLDKKRLLQLVSVSDMTLILTEGDNPFVSEVVSICEQLGKPYKVSYHKQTKRSVYGKNNDKGNIGAS